MFVAHRANVDCTHGTHGKVDCRHETFIAYTQTCIAHTKPSLHAHQMYVSCLQSVFRCAMRVLCVQSTFPCGQRKFHVCNQPFCVCNACFMCTCNIHRTRVKLDCTHETYIAHVRNERFMCATRFSVCNEGFMCAITFSWLCSR